MNHPFIHLLWKSYRSQREIWLAMLGGMLLLQLLALSNVGSHQNHFAIALLIAGLIATVFLCISTLLMFVMEEEQGTALWLRLLPIKWWQQLTAGLLCSLALTVVIALLGITVALASAAYVQSGIPSRPFEKVTEIQFLTVFSIWIVGLTASVLIRRIIVVLPLIAAIAITNAVLTFDLRIHWLPIVASITSMCVLPFAVRRWQLGRPWLWPHIFRCQVANNTGLEDLTTEKSSLRTRFLRRAALADGMQHRTTLVLYWQELVCAVPFAVVGLLLAIASVIYCRTAAYPAPLGIIWFLFFTLECGLRTFRHDQQKQHGLFWAHRGVSPIKVWLIKNSVWLPILLLIAMAVNFLDGFHAAEIQETQFRLTSVLTALADPLAVRDQFGEPWLVNGSRTSPMHLLIAMVTTGFFVAQLCSVWLRPPFVAGFMALLAFSGLPQWIFLCQTDDIPLTFSAWPIAVFCCLATLWTSRHWMDRRQDGWIWTKRVAVVCFLPVGLWLGHQYYRRAQILNGVAAVEPLPHMLQMEADRYLQIANIDERVENPVTDALWRDLMLHGSESTLPDTADDPQDLDGAESPFRCNKIINDIVSTKGWEHSFLPIELRTSWQASVVTVVGRQVTSEANRLVRVGQADDAFDLLCKAVQLSEYLAAQTTDWAELQNCMDVLRSLHQHIHWCVSSDQVNAKELKLATKLFGGPKDYSDCMASMLRNRMDAFQQLWNPNTKLSQEINKTRKVSFYGHQSWTEEYHKLSDTELRRHLILLHSTTNATAVQLRNGLRGITDDIFQWNGQFQRWAKATAEFGFNSDPVVNRLSSNHWTGPLASIEGAINSRRATWWILQFQVYRRELGQQPTDAEFRRWLVEQGQTRQMGWLTNYATNQPHELRLQGSGITTLASFRDTFFQFDANQPLIGDSKNMLLGIEIDESFVATSEPMKLPLNKDRVVFVEQSIHAPFAPPVSGELAELIRNKK